ncbi:MULTISPECIES: hypothetical protein [Peribacillus]|nr:MULTISPECIES: hypothetical protein [unclassified Peribacillus]MCK1984416.1 hypothetical protein [Peribacillus sp. Aquil_B1]MCK2008587.1 hypothetical protein [Peribacillus sp. Aquil_B8]
MASLNYWLSQCCSDFINQYFRETAAVDTKVDPKRQDELAKLVLII